MAYTVEIEGLHKAFGEVRVLEDVHLAVPRGGVVALLGPNGAGKTTAVRILSTLLAADRGRVVVAGHDVAADPWAVRAAISLTGQFAAVDDVLTGRENLLLVARLLRLGRTAARRRAEDLLAAFDLSGAADRRVATYSGGMRRRLDIALGLLGDPQLLVLDEPTTGLDPRSRRGVWASVTALRDRGVTVLLTTQYLEEADALADRITVIDRGHVVAEGTPADLKAGAGAETARLELADPADAATATGVLAARGGHPARYEEATQVLEVATDGTAEDLRAVLNALADAGIPLRRVDLHRPTLDDVFLSLTDTAAPVEVAP
ncbi:ATP-binding cassette domain-containing protein [Euzebya sp.]|uniref:ATP-binding cassette domain-containing protein n=1 Tax=Euzebya sp. TaxID=1971409 RepID=UPI003512FCB4